MIISSNPANKPCVCTSTNPAHNGTHPYTLNCTGAEILA